ncbi:MAG: hypothetical protein GZ088_10260 [Acidipila sp.]|nr:hypothetical protein [Acidipila sp.]
MVAAGAAPVAGPHSPYITSQLITPQAGISGNGSWNCVSWEECGFSRGGSRCFHDRFNCFGGPFSSPYALLYYRGYGPGLYSMGYAGYGETGTSTVAPYNESPNNSPNNESPNNEPPSAPGTYVPNALTPSEPEAAPVPRSITLLALKDGTMCGVVDYWLDHGVLHYIASYGGENSVPLQSVDLDKTVELNSLTGIGFVLRNSRAVRPSVVPSPQ